MRNLATGLFDRLADASIFFSFDRSGFRRHQRSFRAADLEVDLAGKRCLVTGANSGLGYQLALGLAERGAGDEKDETLGWSQQKLFTEATSEMRGGNYAKAIEYYEILESRFPFGKYAHQAQINVAYAYYRYAEPE